MTRRFTRCARLLVLGVALQVGAARGAWVVDEHGDCVREWTPASLGRGPTAMLEAPLVPFRSAAGGVRVALDDQHASTGRKTWLAPAMAALALGTGAVEMPIWLVTGLADTVTGGRFEVAPVEATELSVAPLAPVFVPNGRPAEDRCGKAARRP